MFSIVSITTPHFSTLFALLESPIAPTSLDKGQHPSATPPVGGAFPKEIAPSTRHSGLLGAFTIPGRSRRYGKLIQTWLHRVNTTMTTPLPPDLQQFADRQIASGKYASLEEILLAGLQALAEREQIYQGRFEELRREVWLGVEAAERGELLDAATEIEAIRQRLRDRYSQT